MKTVINLTQNLLLPICAEDAPQFSNDVYNKEYTREKIASRFKQSGRSMIEMLGVLAIVGVLSVGGIAGYSKAMQKYRTNKTIEQVTQIINGVRTLYSGQKSYEGINDSRIMKKAKLLPESAFGGTDGDIPSNPFGGEYWLRPIDRKNINDNKAVLLSLYGVPDDACIELATQDWGAGEGLYTVSVNTSDFETEGCNGKSGESFAVGCAGADTSNENNVPLPIPMDKAISACDSNNNNELLFFFY